MAALGSGLHVIVGSDLIIEVSANCPASGVGHQFLHRNQEVCSETGDRKLQEISDINNLFKDAFADFGFQRLLHHKVDINL